MPPNLRQPQQAGFENTWLAGRQSWSFNTRGFLVDVLRVI